MIQHASISTYALKRLIHQRLIAFGGNSKLKIYGHLHCQSGKRMKKENRVFFPSEQEAELLGYRPCGHCMNRKYKNWKSKS